MLKKITGAVLGCVLSQAALAQTSYPERPIRMVVPFAAGGVVDVTARLLAQKLTERLGWNVIVENKPGGNGFIAVNYVAKAPADGYTVLMAHTGEFAVNPALFKDVPYDLHRDFKPVTLVSDTPLLFVANSKTPFKTFQDVIEAGKKNPGSLEFSSPGTGSYNHLAGEWFSLESGAKLMHIPYKGGAPAMAAVAGGEVPFGVVAVPAVLPHVESGRVRVIGLLTARTMKDHPDWVTAQSAGVNNIDASNWVGVFVPKQTADSIVQKLNEEIAKTLAVPDVIQRFADNGATVGGISPEAFTQRIDTDLANVKDVIQRANIQP